MKRYSFVMCGAEVDGQVEQMQQQMSLTARREAPMTTRRATMVTPGEVTTVIVNKLISGMRIAVEVGLRFDVRDRGSLVGLGVVTAVRF